MRHLSDEELTDAYYGERAPAVQDHLRECPECRMKLGRIEETLGSLEQYIVPEPDASFEERVWKDLSRRLPQKKRPGFFVFRPVVFAPALASLLVLVLSLWLMTDRRRHGPVGISSQAQARVLFNTLTDHLDRSEILLAEVANAKPGSDALKTAQAMARDLADENRLLRLASNRAGDMPRGALLEDLERVLVSVANAPDNLSPNDLSALQERIDEQGLLFKVRITDDDLRREERKL
ncbi:MAG: hypothetical protein ACJ746_04985 [Bryobacteraceae bacterium]